MEEKGEENKAAPRERVADGPRDGTQTRLLTASGICTPASQSIHSASQLKQGDG